MNNMATTTGPVDCILTGKLVRKIWDFHFEESDDDDITPITTPTRHVPSIHDFLDSHHVPGPAHTVSLPVLTNNVNIDDMTLTSCDTSCQQVPPKLPPPVLLTVNRRGEPIRHIPSIHDFLDAPTPTQVDCVVDDVATPLGDVARHHPATPEGSNCCQENTPHVGADPSHVGADPSHVGADPPHVGADPSHAGADPPHVGADPSHVGADPSHVGADPLHVGADPLHVGADPPHVGADPPHVGADPPLRQSAASPSLASLPSARLPSCCASAQRGAVRRPNIPRLPLGEEGEGEREEDRCNGYEGRRGLAKKQSVASTAFRRSVRETESPSQTRPQHMPCGAIPCCHGNEPPRRLTSDDMIRYRPGVYPYTPHPWTPPPFPPSEDRAPPTSLVPNMAALPYELLELLLSFLEGRDLLSCRAVSRRLCAAASRRMRGGKLSLSGHNRLDSFALLNFCWLQPSRVELCHVSGCAGSEELAHFLSAGEECVKSLKYVSCRVETDRPRGGEVCLLQQLAHHWRGVRELNVFLPAHLTEGTTRTIFQRLHSLSHVTVDGSPLNCSKAIRTMAAQHKLSSLSLPSHLLCRQEVHSALKEACFLHSLEEAELKGVTRPSVEWLVALSEVLSAFTNLKRLTLSASTPLLPESTGELLDVVCECAPQLTHLRLARLTAGQASLARLASREVTIEQ